MVGTGRATEVRGDGITLSGAGTAAGILSAAARRQEAPGGDEERVAAAVREAAQGLDVAVGRLRMLDYLDVAGEDPALPGLGVVLATFGTWKAARARAAQPIGECAGEAGDGGRRSS